MISPLHLLQAASEVKRGAYACLFLSLTLVAHANSEIACPSVEVRCIGSTTIQAESHYSFECVEAYSGRVIGSYNLVLGLLNVNAYSSFGASGHVKARDVFELYGGSPRESVSFKAILHVSANLSAGQVAGAGVTGALSENSGDLAEVHLNACCCPPCEQAIVEVPLTQFYREPFVLNYEVRASGIEGGAAEGTVRLEFVELPEGASVLSCHGFSQGAPVPTEDVSWGRMKELFR